MRTPQHLLITGNDTGIGKTQFSGLVARKLAQEGHSVQVIKPVETGVVRDEPGDAQHALKAATSGLKEPHGDVTAHRFFSYSRPLAPLKAAALEGDSLSLQSILYRIERLPDADFRLIEGAGGIAVPVDSESLADWGTLAQLLPESRTLVVVEDRLGTINQARLLNDYAEKHRLDFGFALNQMTQPPAYVAESNREAFSALKLPLWAELTWQSSEITWHDVCPV